MPRSKNIQSLTFSSDPMFSGEVDLYLQMMLHQGETYLFFSILGVVSFSVVSWVGAPFLITMVVNILFPGSMIYLMGISYGIINDIIGCRANLPYFLLGHQYQQKSLIPSNDPISVAIAWGIVATYIPTLAASILFTIAAYFIEMLGFTFVTFVLPAMTAFIPFVLIGISYYVSTQVKARELESDQLSWNNMGLSSYQKERLTAWMPGKRDINTWLSNSDRNAAGYIVMPILGLIGLIASVVFSFYLPFIVSPFFSIQLPIITGILLVTFTSLACTYLYFNEDKIIANKPYKLDFSKTTTFFNKVPQEELLSPPILTQGSTSINN